MSRDALPVGALATVAAAAEQAAAAAVFFGAGHRERHSGSATSLETAFQLLRGHAAALARARQASDPHAMLTSLVGLEAAARVIRDRMVEITIALDA